MMCRRGGSKGGKHPAGTPQGTHIRTQTVATQESHRQTKSNPVGEIPIGSFLVPKWGKSESQKESRGRLPLRKNKDFIDLFRGKGIPQRNEPDIFQSELTTTIPDGGEIRHGHTNSRSQIFIFIPVSTHDRFKHLFIQ